MGITASGGSALGGDIVTGGGILDDIDLGGDGVEATGCCGLISSEGATPEIVFLVCFPETGLAIGTGFVLGGTWGRELFFFVKHIITD